MIGVYAWLVYYKYLKAASGRVSIAFSAKSPSMGFSVKSPAISWSTKAPSVEFEVS